MLLHWATRWRQGICLQSMRVERCVGRYTDQLVYGANATMLSQSDNTAYRYANKRAAFDVDPATGGQYWNDPSDDGQRCNIGYVLAGTAGTSGNPCNNQNPAGWLPYTGVGPLLYLEGDHDFSDSWGFEYPTGVYTFSLLGKLSNNTLRYGLYLADYAEDFDPYADPWSTDRSAPAPIGTLYEWIELTDLSVGEERTITIEPPSRDYNDIMLSVRWVGEIPVPEPASLALLCAGMLGLAAVTFRRRKLT